MNILKKSYLVGSKTKIIMVKPDNIKRIERAYGLKLEKVNRTKIWHSKKSFSLDKNGKVNGLNISVFKVQDLTPIQNFKNLTTLNVRSTQVQDLTPLQNLENLTELNVRSTQIKDLTPVQNFKNLTTLNVRSTQVQDLTPLQNLENLTELYLNSTQVEEIFPLKNLKKIQVLGLKNCRISILPLFLTDWNIEISYTQDAPVKFGTINLFGNPLENVPKEILIQGKVVIQDYLFLAEESSKPLNEVKIIVIGNGGSGKTSLLKRLKKYPFDKNESQTHGISIQKHQMTCEGDKVNINFWDFGGQEINHATHQFFYSERAIYLLVLNARKEDNTEYWLKYIENLGGDSPVIIVMNQIDENPSFDVNRKFLLKKFGTDRTINFCRLSCKDMNAGDGILYLEEQLKQTLNDFSFMSFEDSWLVVKEQLVNLAQTDNYISYNRYHSICLENGIKNQRTQDSLLEFLDALGIVLHFDELRRYDKQVLSPLWLTQGVYRIINSPLIAGVREGEVFFEDLEGILNDFERYHREEEVHYRYPTDTHIYLLEIMQQFELCYELERDHYIIPDLLPKQQPEDLDLDTYPLHFVLEYEDLLPRSVLPRLMVRMHKSIVEGAQNRWRTGVVLENPLYQATAIVQTDYAENEIHVWVKGEEGRKMLTFIRSSLKEINKTFQKLEVIEWLVIGKKGKKLIKVDYEELLILEEENRPYYSTKLRQEFIPKALLDGIELPEVRGLQPLQAFISYSQKDIDLKNDFKTMLHPLKHTHQLELWDDREIDAGKEWEAEILRHLHQDPLIFLLISPDFIATDYIWDVEVPKALDRHRRGEAVVIPIILRPCLWNKLNFSELQALPNKAKPVNTWANQDEALLATGRAIEKVLEGKQIRLLRERFGRWK